MNFKQMALLLEIFLHPQSFVSTFPDSAEVNHSWLHRHVKCSLKEDPQSMPGKDDPDSRVLYALPCVSSLWLCTSRLLKQKKSPPWLSDIIGAMCLLRAWLSSSLWHLMWGFLSRLGMLVQQIQAERLMHAQHSWEASRHFTFIYKVSSF